MDTQKKIKNAIPSSQKDNKNSPQKEKENLPKVLSEGESSSPPKEPPKENKQSPSNKESSRFEWLKIIAGSSLLGTIIAGILSVNESNLHNVRYQRDLVSNYIDAVQTLLLDQFLESKAKDPDRISQPMELIITSKVGKPQQVALFIRSKAGTTLKRLTDKTSKDTLLKFLRRANIGFLPRSGDLTQVDTLKDISKTRESQSLQYSDLLRGIDLSNAQLNDSDLSFAVFQNANLTNSSLISANLSEANLRASRLIEADLRGAKFIGTDLREADLREADLRRKPATFSWNPRELFKKLFHREPTTLYKANLRGAKLQKAKLQEVNFQGANLVYARLTDKVSSDKNKALIKNTSFTYALYVPDNRTKLPNKFKPEQRCMIAIKPELDLQKFLNDNCQNQEIPFDSVNPFKKTDLSRTNLQGANLTQVDFFQTNLAEANLAEAELKGANLAEANLIKAINLTPSQIKSACNWEKAIYKGDWDNNQKKWLVNEQENQAYIKQLKEDKASVSQKPIDCSQ